jgi:hypothetical protein
LLARMIAVPVELLGLPDRLVGIDVEAFAFDEA